MLSKKLTTKKTRKKFSRSTSVTRLHIVAYFMFNDYAKSLYPKFTTLETTIKHSMSAVPFEVYVCTMLFLSLVSGIVSSMLTFVATQAAGVNIIASIVFTLLFGVGIAGMIFGILYTIPGFMVKTRRMKLHEELPHFIGYMSTLSSSGQSMENIFKTIALEDSTEEIVKDARYIARNIDIFGMDVLTSIKEVLNKTPAGAYQELLDGAVSTFEAGGDLKEYFNAISKVQLEEKKLSVKKSIESLGVISEIYTVLLVVFPLLTIIMLSVMAIMTTNLMGFDLPTLIALVTFAILPLCGIMMLVLMDSMTPKR